MDKKAVIYCRVSTDEQAKGYSLKTQADAFEHFAIERGYTILETFNDDYSGASLERPELNRLREYVA